ncbi:unnamed protein product [marine sediment metagenome]|uniref:CMP/dCMP-type deaminase domain-containing protein n=1 Tax=marine sediment metagenome TaxID=412755 RepID=X0Z390_9ZZZZ
MTKNNDKDIDLMQEALKEAEIAYSRQEVPVGAVAVYQNKIIARAHNQKEELQDPTAHAEILAIQQAAKYSLQSNLNSGKNSLKIIDFCFIYNCNFNDRAPTSDSPFQAILRQFAPIRFTCGTQRDLLTAASFQI